MPQAIFVGVYVLKCDRFRADISAAEWVVLVTANVERLIFADRDLDAADRLTQIAASMVDIVVCRRFHRV